MLLSVFPPYAISLCQLVWYTGTEARIKTTSRRRLLLFTDTLLVAKPPSDDEQQQEKIVVKQVRRNG